MKNYIVYVDGIETPPLIRARNHNEAERKAKLRHPEPPGPKKDFLDLGTNRAPNVTVSYTEV